MKIPEPTTPNPLNLFDRKTVRLHRDRAARIIDDHDFLFMEVADRLTDRLDDVKRDFPLALDLGCHGGEVGKTLQNRGNIKTLIQCDLSPAMTKKAAQATTGLSFSCDEEFLPVAPESLDLVLSNLSLHWVNDLPGAFVQIRQALKPDGFFMATLLGEQTLFELRDSLMIGELDTTNGVTPRVSPYATVQDIGGLLQRAGFTMPVVDTDTITVSYPNMFKLMHDLRGMGETGSASERRKSFTRKDTIMRAAEHYSKNHSGGGDVGENRLAATFDVIYITAWSPHPDQPKAAKPGSATHSLADILQKETPQS